MKKQLSVARAVEAAGILFELNTGRQGVLDMAARAELTPGSPDEEKKLLREWYAFVHAAVLYALMVQAPNIVVLEYLRSTQTMLTALGFSPDEASLFVDDAFRAYVDPLVRTRTEECPAVFFRRLLGKEVQDVPARQLAVISGVMAMILAAVLDKLEQYEFLTC